MASVTSHSQASDLARELTVVYADLSVPVLAEDLSLTLGLTFMLWPRQVCDAANDSRFLLHREIIDLAQRNLNAGFSLLRRLTEAKSLGEIIEVQAAHFSNQIAASIGQTEELATLSIQTALKFVHSACPGQKQVSK